MNDWDFKVGEKNAKDDRKKSNDSLKLNNTRSSKVAKTKNIDLKVEGSRKGHVSRSKLAKDLEKKKYQESELASIPKRSISTGIDLAIIIALSYYLITNQNEAIYQFYKELLFNNGMSQTVAKPILLVYIQYAVIVITYLIMSFVPVYLFKRSIGKIILNIHIESIHSDIDCSRMSLVIREFFKLVSTISIVGFLIIFFNKQRRCLHDFIMGTKVV